MLEIQGQRCKNNSLPSSRPKKKKSIQLSLFLDQQKGVYSIDSNRVKLRDKHHSVHLSRKPKKIMLSLEFPTVPFYMPKMISRTPSPSKGARDKNKQKRRYSKSIENSTQNIEIAGKKIDEKKNFVTRSLNLGNKKEKKENFQEFNHTLKKFQKFGLHELDLQLPSILLLKKKEKIKKIEIK